MRRLILLAVLALGLAACGSSSPASKPLTIKFGVIGGSILPYRVVIAPGGSVSYTGAPPVKPTTLSSAKEAELSQLVRKDFPKLTNKLCAHTLPDVATQYVTALGRTVHVHGTCDPRFTQLWNALSNAFGLNA